ncbi:DUF4817 domain-containing protein [Trichonephila clavipes]|nr:DUF4817 domain-containing protein [Trichonephila clavipes]
MYVETPLHPEKLTVWCTLWAGGIVGPYFFKNGEGHNVTVNGDRYRAMITNFFILELNNHDVQELWFQQNGATCHTARATIYLLKDTFNDRLISRFGHVNWPPRSCDLTPLDYFLWGYVKSLVYADKPQTFGHLEDNIRRVIADIRSQMLEKVIENWTSRLDYIRASRGSPMPEIIFKKSHTDNVKEIIRQYHPVCVALQETFLKSCHTTKIRRYGCVWKDTEGPSVSGGVCIFTSLNVPSSALPLHTSLHAVAVRIHSTSLITVCCLYLPPNTAIHQHDLKNLVDQLPAPFVILGDFNGHSTMWGSVKTNPRGRQIEQSLWKEHCFPSSWREAIVIPILKPGKVATDPLSYRPIALTSCFCKTFERMINTRLVYVLEKEKCISPLQSGFRKGPIHC